MKCILLAAMNPQEYDELVRFIGEKVSSLGSAQVIAEFDYLSRSSELDHREVIDRFLQHMATGLELQSAHTVSRILSRFRDLARTQDNREIEGIELEIATPDAEAFRFDLSELDDHSDLIERIRDFQKQTMGENPETSSEGPSTDS